MYIYIIDNSIRVDTWLTCMTSSRFKIDVCQFIGRFSTHILYHCTP